MVTAGDFKNGLTIQFENNIYQIIEFQHVKPGKGAAFVRCKLKNIKNGGVVEKTFRPTEKFENAHIERKEMQYLYTAPPSPRCRSPPAGPAAPRPRWRWRGSRRSSASGRFHIRRRPEAAWPAPGPGPPARYGCTQRCWGCRWCPPGRRSPGCSPDGKRPG